MRTLFDTNVVLDVVLQREPFATTAGALFDAVDAGRLDGVLTPTTLTTTAYFVEKSRSTQVARQTIRGLVGRFEVATVGRAVVDDALALGFSDFEDGVLHEAARHAQAHNIVTRNPDDFARASLPVHEPDELLALLHQQEPDEEP